MAETFETRLARNPYDLCALVGALLESAAQQDCERAERYAAACETLNILPHARRSLWAIAKGSLAVTRRETVFCTRIPLDAPAEDLFSCIDHALLTLGEAIGRPPPLLWVDFQDIPFYANSIRRDVAGLCCLTLSSELFADGSWRPTIWHECGHALLSANCRFLDEGWALWCQYKSGHPSYFPVPHEEAMEGEIELAVAEIPLDGFLRFDAADPAFRDIVESDDEQIAVFLRGYRLVTALIAAAGCAGLASAFDKIAGGANAKAVLSDLSPATIAADEARVSLAGIDRAFRWLRSREPRAGAAFIPAARRIVEEEPARLEAWEVLGRLVGSLVLNIPPGQASRAALVEELEAIVAQLEGLDPGNAIAEMLRGLHTVSQIGLVPSALLISVAKKAEDHLLKARGMKTEDGDLNIALARLEMKKPFSWVADRASALAYLATAAADPRTRWEAVSVASLLSTAPNETGLSP